MPGLDDLDERRYSYLTIRVNASYRRLVVSVLGRRPAVIRGI